MGDLGHDDHAELERQLTREGSPALAGEPFRCAAATTAPCQVTGAATRASGTSVRHERQHGVSGVRVDRATPSVTGSLTRAAPGDLPSGVPDQPDLDSRVNGVQQDRAVGDHRPVPQPVQQHRVRRGQGRRLVGQRLGLVGCGQELTDVARPDSVERVDHGDRQLDERPQGVVVVPGRDGVGLREGGTGDGEGVAVFHAGPDHRTGVRVPLGEERDGRCVKHPATETGDQDSAGGLRRGRAVQVFPHLLHELDGRTRAEALQHREPGRHPSLPARLRTPGPGISRGLRWDSGIRRTDGLAVLRLTHGYTVPPRVIHCGEPCPWSQRWWACGWRGAHCSAPLGSNRTTARVLEAGLEQEPSRPPTEESSWSPVSSEASAAGSPRRRSAQLTWRDLFEAKVYAALAESDPAGLRAALLDVLKVGTAWAECLDNRIATALLAEAADPGDAEVLSLFQGEHPA